MWGNSMDAARRVYLRFVQAKEFDSPEALKRYLKDHPKANRSLHTVKKPTSRKALANDLLVGIRPAKGEPEFNSKKPKAWREAHRGQSPRGSVIHGVMHEDPKHPENAKYVKEQVIPDLRAAAQKARDQGKPVVFLAEGAIGGLEGTEQKMVADALGEGVEQDTWDDAAVQPFKWDEEKQKDVLDLKSPLMKRMTEFTGDADKAAAGVYAMLAGQGDSLEVDPKVKKTLKSMGVDPDDQQAMYRASFPDDFGDKGTLISKVTDEYNRLRQENLMKKVRGIEAKGGVALVAPGASHAWQLAPVFEKG